MRNLASGVTLITSECSGLRGGMTATAVCSLSADPAQILICVNRKSATYGLIKAGGKFCVNVLADSQSQIASVFASPIDWEQKFSRAEWNTLETGAPVLKDALVAFDCEVAEYIDSATHTIFIGRVVGANFTENELPLIYFQGNYSSLTNQESVGVHAY